MSITAAAAALGILTAAIETRMKLRRLREAQDEAERQAIMDEIDAEQKRLELLAMEEIQRDIDDG